jgi:hypothetical protein
MKKFSYLKTFCSPFRRPKLKWYFGKIAIGTPYFFPRRWVKPTHKMAMEAAMEEIAKRENWNERNPQSQWKKDIPPIGVMYQDMLKHTFPVPKKIGFDFVSLGWKTKWSSTDYRFESAPIWSFVFFGKQVAVIFRAPEQDHYWEAWLYYMYDTTGTRKERIAKCRAEFPLKWTVSDKNGKRSVDYYDSILKSKYK